MDLDHDFTADERALLQAARIDERPASAELKQRILLGIGVAASVAGASTAAASGAVAPSISRVLWLGVAKWATVGVATGALTVGATLKLRSIAEHEPSVVAHSVTGARATTAPSVPPPAPSKPSDEEPAFLPRPSMASTVSPRPDEEAAPTPRTQRSGALALEVESLDRVRSALGAGDGAAALRLLDAHHLAFPDGRLVPEAMYMRVRALVLSGNRPAARDLAKRFLAAFPGAPQAASVRALAIEDEPPVHR